VAASISAVELEVLSYLPTKMTFALVADKLGISRSAAKERAERAYKKLGVHNRADAVARAPRTRIDQTHGLKAALPRSASGLSN
jgi:DNA-binding CsgD family transcriptional regulator